MSWHSYCAAKHYNEGNNRPRKRCWCGLELKQISISKRTHSAE